MKRLLAGTAVAALCALWTAPILADDQRPQTDVSTEIARAQALRKAGNLPEAASALAQLMMAAPDDARVVGEYGKVMAQEKRADDALAFLKRAVELQTNDWTLYSALGVAYDENNDPKNAAMAYQHALALSPGQPSVLNNYGMSRMLAGDYTGAQSMFAQAQASGDPRIMNNAAMLAELQTSRMPAVHTAPPKPQMTAYVAPAPKYVPHAAAPVTANELAAATPSPAPATRAPAAMQTASTQTPAATGAPRAIVASNGSQVVMQAVPKDPLAGPVKPKVIKPHHTAVASNKPAPVAPALRTAADTH
jgi:Flp pilus assembly protein TadD